MGEFRRNRPESEEPASPLDLGPNETVCTECWLIQPCECDA
jgi:hypothetical protein